MRVYRGIMVMLCLALCVGCDDEEQQKGKGRAGGPEAVQVTLAPARLQSVQRSIDVFGTLYGDEEAEISAKVAGRVAKRFADIGDHVKAGAPLAQLETVDYELALAQSQSLLMQTLAKLGLSEMPDASFDPDTVPTVEQARLKWQNAQAVFARSEALFKEETPLISEEQYTNARTTAEVARSEYEVAKLAAKSLVAEARTRLAEIELQKKRLADTTVRAPEGSEVQTYSVVERLVSVGEYVKDATPMFRVIADDPIRFRASVPERFLAEAKVGQPVVLEVEAYGEPFKGEVKRINPRVDRQRRSFEVEALVANKDGKLRAGAFAKGRIATHIDAEVTFVPANAVVAFAGVRKVFTVEAGKAVQHEVGIGTTSDGFVEITSGLKGVPEVVVSGANRLADGVPVTVGKVAEPSTQRAD